MRLRTGTIAVFACLAIFVLGNACTVREDAHTDRRIAAIATEDLRAHVEALAAIGPRPSSDPEASRRTVAYLEARLGDWGYRPERETFRARSIWAGRDADPVEHHNVIAVRTGTTRPDRIVEVGAHYDSVPFGPGADDDASGVAALLEIARISASLEFRRTLRFCFFGMEEDGLRGSRHHVGRILARGEDHDGILVFEMVGYTSNRPGSQATPLRIPIVFDPPRAGNFLAIVGNFHSSGLGGRVERAARRHVPELRVFSMKRIGGLFVDAARSDHYPYWDAGIRGVMLTDTANFRNPNYHRPTDTPETLDFEFLTQTARVAAATVLEWAEALPLTREGR